MRNLIEAIVDFFAIAAFVGAVAVIVAIVCGGI